MKDGNILVINNGLAGGGIERASISMANFFSKNGNNVTLLALYRSEHFFQLDSNIRFIEPEFNRNNTNKYLYLLKMLFYVRTKTNLIKPDVVLAYGEWTNPYVILALTGIGIPVYVSDRMSPIGKLPFLSKFLREKLYKRAKGIIAQTNFAKEIIYKQTGSKNIKVIPNPVNVINKINCEQKNRIVTVGRLSKEKGHNYLIEAFSFINDNEWELSIVGDGPERENLNKLAESLGIKHKVLFSGHLRDFSKELSEAKIFVLPSLKEGFPNSLIEAMSLPIACISSNCIAGPADIIENGINGILVEPASVEQLSKALDLLIQNESLRQKISNKAFEVRSKYGFQNIANEYLNFIFDQNE
jgi:glycosyltransferase involved in cell wall biosynthesis